MSDSAPKIRFPRTGTLVLIAMVLLVGGGALMVWLPYQREQRVIAEIERLGGITQSEIVRPLCIPNAVDDKFMEVFERISMVILADTDVRDSELKILHRSSNLQILLLDNTQVSDAGLEHLRELTKLEWLSLSNTQVSDSGLEHLQGLSNLKELWVDNTPVTKEGIENLEKALPNCDIIGTPSYPLHPRRFFSERN